MSPRPSTGAVAVTAAAALLALTVWATADASAQSVGTFTVAIDMSGATVGERAARQIRTELDRLWAPYGATFTWSEGVSGLSEECTAVKVVFSDDEPGIKARPGRRPLGIVYRVGDFWRRIIFVSPSAVMRLVRKSGAAPPESFVMASLHARMMARVIAHELGHILLDTDGHAPRGLMRRGFKPADVVQHGRESFTLDPAETERVARRCAAASRAPAIR